MSRKSYEKAYAIISMWKRCSGSFLPKLDTPQISQILMEVVWFLNMQRTYNLLFNLC